MDKLKVYVESFKNFTKRNSPTILTTLGVIGVAQTAYMSYKAGLKAKPIVDAKRQDLKDIAPSDKETKRIVYGEMVKEVAPIVIPPTIMGTMSCACIIGANRVSSKRIAAISAAYSLTETALKEYKDKTVELIGEKKAQNIREAIAKDKVRKNPPPKDVTNNYIEVGDGNVLCYDSYSGRYFHSNAQKINNAINKVSWDVRSDMYVSLNEFWDAINSPELPRTDMGDDFGWNVDDVSDGKLPISITAVLTPDEKPCLSVMYDIHLRDDFRNLY
jgi:hypothetical protein